MRFRFRAPPPVSFVNDHGLRPTHGGELVQVPHTLHHDRAGRGLGARLTEDRPEQGQRGSKTGERHAEDDAQRDDDERQYQRTPHPTAFFAHPAASRVEILQMRGFYTGRVV